MPNYRQLEKEEDNAQDPVLQHRLAHSRKDLGQFGSDMICADVYVLRIVISSTCVANGESSKRKKNWPRV